ncbi:MAG: hypothetical protein Fur0039_12080 [Rhodocyclaceae bacterium]
MSDAQSAPQPVGAASPGEALRRAREARSLTVAEVAEALKLRPRQIEAIENGDFASFKGAAFARGFVRSYARLLAMDPAPLLAAMSDAAPGEAVRLSPPSNAEGEMPRGAVVRGAPRSLALVALAGLAAVILAMFYDRLAPTQGEPRPAATPRAASAEPVARPAADAAPASAPARPAAEPEARVSQETSATAAASVAPEAAALTPAAARPAPQSDAAAGAAARIELRFARPSWVEITDATGKVLFSRTGPAGGAATVEGAPPFSLWIGNAGAVELKYRDRRVDLAPHTNRNVARLRLE